MLHLCQFRHHAGHDVREQREQPELFYFILMTYGRCLYRIDGERLLLEKGDLLLIPARLPFYDQSIPTVFHEKYTAAFLPSGLLQALPWLDTARPVRWKTGLYELLHDRFKQMAAEWTEGDPFSGPLCEGLLWELLALAGRELAAVPPNPKRQAAEAMIAYIKARHREKLTKHELADHIGKSPNYAAALFHEVTGFTIGDYVHRCRIRTAEYMLAESRLSVAEIAEYVGYTDPSYFHRTFKRLTGRTPKA